MCYVSIQACRIKYLEKWFELWLEINIKNKFWSRRPSVSLIRRDSCTEVDMSWSKQPTLTRNTPLGVNTCSYRTFYNTLCKRYLWLWYRNDDQSAKSFFPTIPFEKLYLRMFLSFFHTYCKACLKRFMAKKPGKKKYERLHIRRKTKHLKSLL